LTLFTSCHAPPSPNQAGRFFSFTPFLFFVRIPPFCPTRFYPSGNFLLFASLVPIVPPLLTTTPPLLLPPQIIFLVFFLVFSFFFFFFFLFFFVCFFFLLFFFVFSFFFFFFFFFFFILSFFFYFFFFFLCFTVSSQLRRLFDHRLYLPRFPVVPSPTRPPGSRFSFPPSDHFSPRPPFLSFVLLLI